MSSTLTALMKVRIPDDVLFQEVNDQAALLHLTTERYYGLDDVGTRMWRALESSGSIDGACEHLLEIYDVPRDTLLDDLRTFAETLRGHDLLESIDG